MATSTLRVPHIMPVKAQPMPFHIFNGCVPTNAGQIYNINILAFTCKKIILDFCTRNTNIFIILFI